MSAFLTLILFTIPALASLHCRPQLADGCVLTACVGTIGNYPAPVVALWPPGPRSLRVHLHGFSERVDSSGALLGPYQPDYDWDNVRYPTPEAATRAFAEDRADSPAKLLRAYGMARQMCQRGEAVVVPTSRGHCHTYAQHFISPRTLGRFVEEVHGALGFPASLPLHLSGHSGAGKTMQAVLAAETPTLARLERITAFDAFYSSAQTQALSDWAYRRGRRQVRVVVLNSGSPRAYARRAWRFPRHNLPNGSQIHSHTVTEAEGADHWSLVRDFWTWP